MGLKQFRLHHHRWRYAFHGHFWHSFAYRWRHRSSDPRWYWFACARLSSIIFHFVLAPLELRDRKVLVHQFKSRSCQLALNLSASSHLSALHSQFKCGSSSSQQLLSEFQKWRSFSMVRCQFMSRPRPSPSWVSSAWIMSTVHFGASGELELITGLASPWCGLRDPILMVSWRSLWFLRCCCLTCWRGRRSFFRSLVD